MTAGEVARLYGGALVGLHVDTEAVGDWPGGRATVIHFGPDPAAPEIVYRVVSHEHVDPDSPVPGSMWEMGIFEYEELAIVDQFTPVEVALALALYGYNVSPTERARLIYRHFDGRCAEEQDLVRYCVDYGTLPTAMAFPSVEVYTRHALERYGHEARARALAEQGKV